MIVKTTEFETTVVPLVVPGFVTVTIARPAVAKSAAGTMAVRLVAVL